MVISQKEKFVFVHVPKAAGTSVRSALIPYADLKYRIRPNRARNMYALWSMKKAWLPLSLRIAHKHAPFKDADLVLKTTSDFFVFGFIRNPWERLVSRYHYIRKSPGHALFKRMNSIDFNTYVTSDFVKDSYPDQISYLVDRNDKLAANFIGRFEFLREDFIKICEMLGVNAVLAHVNPSKHTHYSKYYTAETREIVRKAFERDIEFGKYVFEEK